MSVFRTVQAPGLHEGALQKACQKLGYTLQQVTSPVAIFNRQVDAKWVIAVPDLAYPVGVTVTTEKTGEKNLNFHWDNWTKTSEHIATDIAEQIRTAYGAALTEETAALADQTEEYARQQGWLSSRETQEDGTCIITIWQGD